MSATFEEILMAPGSFSLDCDWDADVANALKVLPGPHLQLWWGEQLLPPWVVLTADLDPAGIQIGGHSLLWHLGVGADGPVIEDREYLAGTNKLGDGGFEAGAGSSYWKTGEGSLWVIGSGGFVRSGAQSAQMSAVSLGRDDVLASSETFDAVSGQTWQADVWGRRVDGGTFGALRVRLVYDGEYHPPNLVQNGDFSAGNAHWTYTDNVGSGPPQIGVVGGVLVVGPITQPQFIPNQSFELGLLSWGSVLGSWYSDSGSHIDGSYSVSTAGAGPALRLFQTAVGVTCKPGERWRFGAYTARSPDADGAASFSIRWFGPTIGDRADQSQQFRTTDINGSTWTHWADERDVPGDADNFLFYCVVRDQTTGIWSFDGCEGVRIRGNENMAESDAFTVIPGLAYHATATVHSDVVGTGGSVHFEVRFTATGRPDVIQVGYDVENTKTLDQVMTLDFTPPSGYGSARIRIIGRDIVGQPFKVKNVDVRQTDASVSIIEQTLFAVAADGWRHVLRFGLAPTGTDRVHLEIIGDADTRWAVDDVSLVRFGVISTVASIVADLLKHPDTGLSLLGAGTIHGTDTLLYDWRIRFFTNLAALQHLARSGVALPVREYRVDADAKLSFGTAGPPDNLFTDRSAFVFSKGQVEVLQAPDAIISGEERITKVRVIGADRRRPNGDHLLITGTATNPSGGSVDWFGNPVARTRVVQDSAVDQPDYASSLARYQADMVLSAGGTRLQLADWTTSGQFDVGDWVYVYKPEAGLEDSANERTIDGRVVFPARRRVVSRTLNPGPGPFRAELRLPDGSTLPLSVRWNDKTTAEIEVGDPRPEFVTDPQGGPAGLQLLRFRSSQGGRAA